LSANLVDVFVSFGMGEVFSEVFAGVSVNLYLPHGADAGPFGPKIEATASAREEAT
jgi:hypothetical protein